MGWDHTRFLDFDLILIKWCFTSYRDGVCLWQILRVLPGSAASLELRVTNDQNTVTRPSHIILTPGQPVLYPLNAERQARKHWVLIYWVMVWLDRERSRDLPLTRRTILKLGHCSGRDFIEVIKSIKQCLLLFTNEGKGFVAVVVVPFEVISGVQRDTVLVTEREMIGFTRVPIRKIKEFLAPFPLPFSLSLSVVTTRPELPLRPWNQGSKSKKKL